MRFFLLFLFFWSLSSATFAENIPSIKPINEAAVIDKEKNSNGLVYQQIFSMQSQLARLDERLEVQKSLGNDVKLLENTQQELKTQLASLQTKLETQEKLQTNQLNGFNGRISDIASNTNMWGMAFTIFGLIITVAAIALGFSAKNRAVYEAKQTANTTSKIHMEKWLLDNKDKLIADTKTELENVSLQLKDRAEKLEVEARDALEKIKQEQQLAWDALLAENKDVVTSKRNKEDNTTTKYNKPKVYQTAQEWFKAGLKAFSSNEYDEALNAWNKVLGLVDSEQESKLYAITMLNQGVTYGRLSKPNDELNSYATLIDQFKDSSNEEVQIQVAKAVLNQGVTYGQQGKFEDAISSYATVIEQFKDSSNEEVQIRVANAFLNQGVTYGQQGKLEDVFSSLTTLIEQFKGSPNEEVQKIITNSRANIAELALLYETPEQILNRVVEAEKHSDNPENLAVMQFIRFLLDDKTIEEVFTALTAIPTAVKLTWNFGEIKDYLTDNFDGIKQQQIQAVVQYFEQHKDIERLRGELGIVS